MLVPAYTFPATANVVALAGARPVLVDVDPVTMNIDAEKLAADVVARVTPLCVAAAQLLDTDELVRLWRSGRSPGLTEPQRRQYLAALTGSG